MDAGVAEFEVSHRDPFLLARGSAGRSEVLPPIACRLTAEDASGVPHELRGMRVEVVERGPLRTSVRLSGQMAAEAGTSVLDVFIRLDFFAGLPVVRVDVTLRNPRRARHPGGIWELGDKGLGVLARRVRWGSTCRLLMGPRGSCAPLKLDGHFRGSPCLSNCSRTQAGERIGEARTM